MKMNKLFASLLLGLLVLSAGSAFAQGNGALSGPHYNLNIIGHNNCPGDDLVGSKRHVIAVKLNFNDGSQHGSNPANLDKTNKIFLQEADDFEVYDGNACDGDGATFRLPANPFSCPADDPDCLDTDPTFQEYTVWARALGSPKNSPSATITTCATDPDTNLIVCSTENVVLVRNKGKSSFSNVTKELTTIVGDVDGDGDLERVGLFEDDLEDYFWDYDNNGLRLAQLRFYPIPD